MGSTLEGMRLAIAVLMVIPAFANAAAERCSPSETFSEFFARYQHDPSFQNMRVSKTVRYAKPADAGGESERVDRKIVTGAELLRSYGSFPDETYRVQQQLMMRKPEVTRTTAKVRVLAEGSDSYHRTYIFARLAGCWVLQGFEDNAL